MGACRVATEQIVKVEKDVMKIKKKHLYLTPGFTIKLIAKNKSGPFQFW